MAQRLSLCMIVRDEEAFLSRCLESVKGVVDEIIVVDTGSTDGTIAVARRFGAVIKEVPWSSDFSAARNASLELATGDWILMLDADEALVPESAASLPAHLADPSVEGYFIQMRHLIGSIAQPEVEVSPLFRLWRNRPAYRFAGEIHEQILPSILHANPKAKTVYSSLQAVHYGYLREVKVAKGKQDRNRLLLEERLARNPQDAFTQFNLGIEYYDRRQFDKAAAAFEAALADARPQDPWRTKLVKAYAATLYERQAWERLFAFLDEEIRRYPDYTDLYFLTATARAAVGQHREAADAYARCLRLGPAPSPPYASVDPGAGSYKAALEMGRAYEALGMNAKAIAAYKQAAQSRPGWHSPLKLLAALLGRTAEDPVILQELAAFFPGGQYADKVQVATLLLHARRPHLVTAELQPLLQAGKLERAGKFVLARALAEAGERDAALAICREDWAGSPLAAQVRELRRTLEGRGEPEDRLGVET